MNRQWRAAFLFCIVLLLPFVQPVQAQAQAQTQTQTQPDCFGDARITESFSNGARWDMCWESRIRENLVLSDIHYTPPGGIAKRILSSARLSQLHVAYDDSDVTYNDVTQYGLGGGYLVSLSESDCPDGTLMRVQTRPAVCRWRSVGNDSYRTATRSAQAESLTLFSVSQVGAYAYIVTWKFYDNGTIGPQIGASGALQRSSVNLELPFGRVLQGDDDTLWLSHTHNYYWRLDFDLGHSSEDDVVSEISTTQRSDGKRTSTRTVFTTEQARRINPTQAVAWEILDNPQPEQLASGYRIEPIRYGHRLVRATNEPYTDYDFFVTVANDCERFASQNARFNPDCLNHVLQFANDESTVGQDIVVWHRVGFHHVPRSEDQRHMHTHWDGFAIEPVNVHAATPGVNSQQNSAPDLLAFANQSNNIGDTVDLHLEATDPDGDPLSYSVVGLPPGINADRRGHLHGTLSQAGSYMVTVQATDELEIAETQFSWQVSGSKKSRGSIGLLWLAFLPMFVAFRRYRVA